ncbi:MAG TPA: hypothetical protein VL727_14885 [Puia sp.]|jgi:hypothetical protein|nr:hypothetical protein [Puia sp.]
MKNLIWILSILLTLRASGEVKKDTLYLSTNDLIGVWQRNFKEAGNGLLQNFRFFRDSTFEIHFSNEDEDARDIRELKGTYRLVNRSLYLTIKSRVVVQGGKIAITESSESGYIFHFTGGISKEIAEADPHESRVPIYINVIEKGKIMLDNETYYKMTRDDLRNEGIKGAF